MHQRLPTPPVALEYHASGETPRSAGVPYLCTSPDHVDDDVQSSALDAFLRVLMDERVVYIGEVLDWYRGDNAGDLKRSDLK